VKKKNVYTCDVTEEYSEMRKKKKWRTMVWSKPAVPTFDIWIGMRDPMRSTIKPHDDHCDITCLHVA